jgi:hypothetical protein
MSLSGGSQVGRTSQLLNLADELRFDYGTTNPESVLYIDGRTFAVDANRGVVWRYSLGNGQMAISDRGMHKYWQAIQPQAAKRNLVYSGYDRAKNILYITIGGVETVMFFDKGERSRWIGFNSDVPDVWGNQNLLFLSGGSGRLYTRLDFPNGRLNYKGVQYDAFVEAIFNSPPEVMKLPNAVEIHGTRRWHIDLIEVPRNASYPFGQKTEIPPDKFSVYENTYRADVPRDFEDRDPRFNSVPFAQRKAARINGARPIRAKAATLRVRIDNPVLENTLRVLYIWYMISKRT